MPSLFQQHTARWINCTACSLCKVRNRVVLARGTVPADVVFIGEAPGRTENLTGLPFQGPAGHLLNAIIARAVPEGVTYAITNLVACLPLYQDSEDEPAKVGIPDDPEVKACSTRLKEFIGIARPKLIVCVGTPAAEWLNRGKHKGIKFDVPIPMAEIIHPAAILRMPYAAKGLKVQQCVVTVQNAIEDHVTGIPEEGVS